MCKEDDARTARMRGAVACTRNVPMSTRDHACWHATVHTVAASTCEKLPTRQFLCPLAASSGAGGWKLGERSPRNALMEPRLASYLRTFRRHWGFSQKEMAFLLDITDASQMSRYEKCISTPTARNLILLEMIFNASPEALFPALCEDIEDALMRRALVLLKRLEEANRPADQAKIEFLRALPRRDATIRLTHFPYESP